VRVASPEEQPAESTMPNSIAARAKAANARGDVRMADCPFTGFGADKNAG
jgi:hypothetical protein